jgi:RNA recognition motif-containing protein
VGNLSFSTDEKMLSQLCEKAAIKPTAVFIPMGNNKKPKGFGFLEFATKEEGDNAIKLLHKSKLDGREINVQWSEKK